MGVSRAAIFLVAAPLVAQPGGVAELGLDILRGSARGDAERPEGAGGPTSQVSAEQLLAGVDKLRHPWPAFAVNVEIAAGTRSLRWRVRARENGDARVDGVSEKEKGRSVLVLGDQMWLLLPNARRPVQVSPAQRLLGPAAGGDIARTRFAGDYAVKTLGHGSLEGQPVWLLDLEAKRKSLTHRSARLAVSKADGRPLQADFFLASGKAARTVKFAPPGMASGRRVLTVMTVFEPAGGSAQIRFSGWAPGAADPKAFDLPK